MKANEVNLENVAWGEGDETFDLKSSDFTWQYREVKVSEIGCDNFQEFITNYIIDEIDTAIFDTRFESVESYVLAIIDGELTDDDIDNNPLLKCWVEMLLTPNLRFKDPVQVTDILVDDAIDGVCMKRPIICDGWHRISIAKLLEMETILAIEGKKI